MSTPDRPPWGAARAANLTTGTSSEVTMPRRSPAEVRARLPRRFRRHRTVIPGLAPSVHRQFQNYELDNGLEPGHVVDAYLRYRAWAFRGRPLKGPYGGGTPDNAYDWRGDLDDSRTVIELALRSLTPRARRQFRVLIIPLDEAYQAWSLPNPFASPQLPWWVCRYDSIG